LSARPCGWSQLGNPIRVDTARVRSVIEQATAVGSANEAERVRTIRRLRDELRRIHRRDYFPPTERDTARQAVEALAEPRTKADARR
jgi:hypothetical protein